jgi:hypothetical protein
MSALLNEGTRWNQSSPRDRRARPTNVSATGLPSSAWLYDQAPERSGGPVAEQGVATEMQNGRRLPAERLERLTPDEIDVAMVGMEPPVLQTMLDCSASDAGPEQLAPVDEAPLASGDAGDLAVAPPEDLFGSPNCAGNRWIVLPNIYSAGTSTIGGSQPFNVLPNRSIRRHSPKYQGVSVQFGRLRGHWHRFVAPTPRW